MVEIFSTLEELYIYSIHFWLSLIAAHTSFCNLSLSFRLFFLQSGPVQSLTPIAPAPQTLPPPITTMPTMSAISTISPFASERIPQEPSYQAPNDRLFYMTHNCTPDCLKRIRPTRPNLHRGRNPLLTPLLYEFRRMTARRRLNRKVSVWGSTLSQFSVSLCLKTNLVAIQSLSFS